jgi:DNA-binding SARP family transcriptional activator/tetratricopeptide (TPR) repeat protein
MWEFQLLGPVEARVGGHDVDVGPPQRRAVLAALLTDADHPVTTEALIDRVWGDTPPVAAAASLYSHIARLRGVMARTTGPGTAGTGGTPPRLVRCAGGYVLRVAPDQVDLHRFRHLVDQARDRTGPERVEVLRQACALWRGEPLAGTAGAWAERMRSSWRQAYLDASVAWAHAEVEAGNYAAVTARLPDLVGEHPLVEPLATALMRALSASGRTPEALACYAALRQRLVEELGTDPGPEAQRLHEAILRGDLERPHPSDPGHSTARPRHAEPVAPMVGRTAELTVLDHALDRLATARPHGPHTHVVEIVGEPGIGKTCLLAELAHRATRHGLRSFTGRSAQFDHTPYGAFVDALDDHLAAVTGDRSITPAARHLAGVFPALGGDHQPASEAVGAQRYWVHQAVRSLLEAVAGDRGLVLCLDDLHWADEGTCELVEHLLRHPPGAPVLVAIAYRPRQIPARLAAALTRAEGQEQASRLELGPLSRDDAARLYRKELGPERWRQLYAASGGNPFYIEALARMPVSSPAATVPSDPGGDIGELPRAVRDALLVEVEGLPAPATLALRAAAVLGDTFAVEMVSAVAGTDEVSTVAALDELVARDLVRPTEVPGRFRFRHTLVRAAVHAGTGPGWLMYAHGRAADELAARGAAPAALASHVQRSARPGDTQAAETLAAAARTVATVAPATAARWTGAALRLLGDDGRNRPDLWLQQATALGSAGQLRESLELLRTTASLLPAGSDEQRAQVVFAQATMEWMLGDYDEATRLLRREVGYRAGRGLETTALDVALTAVAQRTDDFPGALVCGERALRSARRTGADSWIATARGLLALACTSTGEHRRARQELAALVATLDRAGNDQPLYINALVTAGWAELLDGEYEVALKHLSAGLELSRRTGDHQMLSDLYVAQAYVHLSLGALAEAAECAQEALEAASFLGSREASSFAAAVLAAVRLWQGDPATARKTCAEFFGIAPDAPVGPEPATARAAGLGVLGHALLATGDPDGCVRVITWAGGGHDLHRFEATTRSLWFGVLTDAELARNDLLAAGEWIDRAEASVTADAPAPPGGYAALARAGLRLAVGDRLGAARFASRAAEAFTATGMRLYEAAARLRAGTALAALPDHRSDALAHLRRAESLFDQCGARVLAQVAAHQCRAVVPAPPTAR